MIAFWAVSPLAVTCDQIKEAHCGGINPCHTLPFIASANRSIDRHMTDVLKTRYRAEGCCDGSFGIDSERADRDVCYPFSTASDGSMFTRTEDYLLPARVWLWESAAGNAEEVSVETSLVTGQPFLTIRPPQYCEALDAEHARILSLPSEERKQHLCVPNSQAVQYCKQTFSGESYPGFNTYPPNFVLGLGARRKEDGTVTSILAQPSVDKKTITVEFDVKLSGDKFQQLFEIVFSLDEEKYGKDADDVRSLGFDTLHNRVERDMSGPLRRVSGVKRSQSKSNWVHETGLGNARGRTKAPSLLIWTRANQLGTDADGNPMYGKEMNTVRLQSNDYLLAPTQIYQTDANGYHWIETTAEEYASLHFGQSAEDQYAALLSQRSGMAGECLPSPDPFVEALKSGKRDFTRSELVDVYMQETGQTYNAFSNVFIFEEEGVKRYFYSPLRSAPPFTQSPGNMGTVLQLQKRGNMETSKCSDTECVYHLRVDIDYQTVMNEHGIGSARLTVDEKPVCSPRIGTCHGQADCDTAKAGFNFLSPVGDRVWTPWPVGHNVTMVDGKTTIVQKGLVELPKDACALPISSLFEEGPKAVFLTANGGGFPVSIANLTSHASSTHRVVVPFPFPQTVGVMYAWKDITFWNGRMYSNGTLVLDPPLSVGDVLRQSHLDHIHAYGVAEEKAFALPNLDRKQWIEYNKETFGTFAVETTTYPYEWSDVTFWNGHTYSNGTKVFASPISAGDILRQSHLDAIHLYGTTENKQWAVPNADPQAWIDFQANNYATFRSATGVLF